MNNKKLIFSRSKGNKISRTFKVFFDENLKSYELIFFLFDRTDPLIKDKLKGVRPKRILLDKKVFFFDDLRNVDFSRLPSRDLTSRFIESMPITGSNFND